MRSGGVDPWVLPPLHDEVRRALDDLCCAVSGEVGAVTVWLPSERCTEEAGRYYKTC